MVTPFTVSDSFVVVVCSTSPVVPALFTRTETKVFDGFVTVASAFALASAPGTSVVTAASAVAVFDCVPPSESPSLSTRSSIAVLLGLSSVAAASALAC